MEDKYESFGLTYDDFCYSSLDDPVPDPELDLGLDVDSDPELIFLCF